MQITIKRPPFADTEFTISTLEVDGVYFSDCLEDRDRGLYQADTLHYINSVKIKHHTAIPYGTYQVVMSYSNKFKQFLPELLEVPGYSGIRIHSGNTIDHTSGCILPGIKSGNKVINSKATTNKLISLINKRTKKEKIFLTILPSK